MPRVYVSVGSNVEPARHVRAALRALEGRFGPLRVSPVYASRAVGFAGADFLNLVVGFVTEESPEAVDRALKAIEAAQGRRREGPRFSDRTLDLDLILYGDTVRREGPLELPRGEVLEHAHVLCPLADLAGEEVHPVAGRTYRALWASFPDKPEGLRPVAFDPEPVA